MGQQGRDWFRSLGQALWIGSVEEQKLVMSVSCWPSPRVCESWPSLQGDVWRCKRPFKLPAWRGDHVFGFSPG